MNKRLNILLCLVMAAAVTLMLICLLQYLNLGKDLRLQEKQLSESRASWEKIAEEKETLQAELKKIKEDLKEAELSYSEFTEKITKLTEENESLQKEIDRLKKEAD